MTLCTIANGEALCLCVRKNLWELDPLHFVHYATWCFFSARVYRMIRGIVPSAVFCEESGYGFVDLYSLASSRKRGVEKISLTSH